MYQGDSDSESSFASESSDSEISVNVQQTSNKLSPHVSTKERDTVTSERVVNAEKEGPINKNENDKSSESFSEASFFNSSSSDSSLGMFVDKKTQKNILAMFDKGSKMGSESDLPNFDHASIDTYENRANQYFAVEKTVAPLQTKKEETPEPNASFNKINLNTNEKGAKADVKVSRWLDEEMHEGDDYDDDFEVSDSINNLVINEEFDKITATSATDDTEMEQQHSHASRIQSYYRGFRCRSHVIPKLQKRKEAAINLQKIARGCSARKLYKNMYTETVRPKQSNTEEEIENNEKNDTDILNDVNKKENRDSHLKVDNAGLNNWPEKQDEIDGMGYYDEEDYYYGGEHYNDDKGQQNYRGRQTTNNSTTPYSTHDDALRFLDELAGQVDLSEKFALENNEIETKSSKEDIDTLDGIDNFISTLPANIESPNKTRNGTVGETNNSIDRFDEILETQTNIALKSMTNDDNNIDQNSMLKGQTETVLVIGSLEEKEIERKRRIQQERIAKRKKKVGKLSTLQQRKSYGAINFQRLYRGYIGRKYAKIVRIKRRQKFNVHRKKNFKAISIKKAIIIQKYVRRYLVISGPILREKKIK